MKLSIIATLFVLATLCIVSIMSVAAMPRDHILRRQQQRLRNDNACVDNITESVTYLGAAVGEVIQAICDCPKPNNTETCVADISKVVADLSEAASYVSQAVIACSNGNA